MARGFKIWQLSKGC